MVGIFPETKDTEKKTTVPTEDEALVTRLFDIADPKCPIARGQLITFVMMLCYTIYDNNNLNIKIYTF